MVDITPPEFTQSGPPGYGKVSGVYLYNDGFIACRGSHVFFSFDGTNWIQVNRDCPDFVGYTDFIETPELPRTGATSYTFDTYTNGDESGRVDLLIHDGSSAPAVFTVIGDNYNTATYRYVEITTEGLGNNAYGLVHEDQHIVAGNSEKPSSFFVSALTDMEDFSGTQSGEYSVADPIVGIKSFRDILYVFCTNSIWKASDLNNTDLRIEQVTRNIGCVDHATIQEIGGELIFLAEDGIRSLGATERIDDVNLATISMAINPLIIRLLNNKDKYTFSSVVLKHKSQYRLFYLDENNPLSTKKGIIATFYKETAQSQINDNWAFSEIDGIEVTAIHSGFRNGITTTVHSDQSGRVFFHDVGYTFNGDPIPATYHTPFMSFGDPGLRKNVREVTTYVDVEGTIDLKMDLKHDMFSPLVHQPSTYPVDPVTTYDVIGEAVIGIFVIGSSYLLPRRVHTQGSGMTQALNYTTTEYSFPYSIQGYEVDLTTSGRI